MQLHHHLNSFGQYLRQRFGERIHKLSLNAGFTCPNRDGSRGHGGCTFCNNASFSPNARRAPTLLEQIHQGREVVSRRTGARRYLAYFQAYTNTYGDVATLDRLYRSALVTEDVIGLSVGTRPDCVPDAVLDLLARLRDEGKEVWLELGLQSAFDHTLDIVNRGHGFSEYRDAVQRARARGIPVCTHLILGLPGETAMHGLISLRRVLELGVDGLKLHPLHVVKNSALARDWREGRYRPMPFADYVMLAAELIRHTPRDVVFHRITATASEDLLLAPDWCSRKWPTLNAIGQELVRHGGQGHYPMSNDERGNMSWN